LATFVTDALALPLSMSCKSSVGLGVLELRGSSPVGLLGGGVSMVAVPPMAVASAAARFGGLCGLCGCAAAGAAEAALLTLCAAAAEAFAAPEMAFCGDCPVLSGFRKSGSHSFLAEADYPVKGTL